MQSWSVYNLEQFKGRREYIPQCFHRVLCSIRGSIELIVLCTVDYQTIKLFIVLQKNPSV